MLNFVQHLIKSRPNSLSLGKSWEVALVSLVPQGFKIPLQSEDTALFQRDWDMLINGKKVPYYGRKTLPCSKGIETVFNIDACSSSFVGRHCPVPKGLRQPAVIVFIPYIMSEDTALFQRDWDFPAIPIPVIFWCRKTLPCSKGIETSICFCGVEQWITRKTLPSSIGIETTTWAGL